MKHVSILVPESSVIEAIADPRYLLNAVNQFLQSTGKPALFDVHLVAAKPEVRIENSAFSVHADMLMKDVKKTDLIFIPALSGNMKTAIELKQRNDTVDTGTI